MKLFQSSVTLLLVLINIEFLQQPGNDLGAADKDGQHLGALLTWNFPTSEENKFANMILSNIDKYNGGLQRRHCGSGMGDDLLEKNISKSLDDKTERSKYLCPASPALQRRNHCKPCNHED